MSHIINFIRIPALAIGQQIFLPPSLGVCWDERWFYLEQTFTSGAGLAAVGWVKGALLGVDGIVDPQTVLGRIAPGTASPPIPEAIASWNELTKEKLQSGG